MRALVTHKDNHNNSYPYAKTTYGFFRLIVKVEIPSNIKKDFTSSFVFGLHKNPEDLTKFRPVAVGGGWRRAFTSTIDTQNSHTFKNSHAI